MQTVSNPEKATADQAVRREVLAEEYDRKAGWQRVFSRLDLLWSERRFLSRFVVAGLVAATLLAFLIPSRYDSTTQLMPPDSQSGSTIALLAGLAGKEGGSGLAGMASDLLGMKSTGDLFIGVLHSRTVQDAIVQQFDLKKSYGVRLEVQARQELADRTSISEERKSGIISVTVSDHDPTRAAKIAEAYVNELDVLMAQLTTSSAHRERVFLEGRLKAVNTDLQSAEQNFSQFASKNTTIDVTEQAKAMLESSAILEGQLIAAQSQLEGLKQIYTDNNVRVRSTQARIDELRQQLQNMAGKAGGSAAAEKEDTPNQPYPSLRQLPILGVPYADLFRRLKVEETVYETLTKEYELAKVQEAKEIPTVKVLDAPDVPEKKAFPPRMLIVFMGGMSALILGILWVIGSARWQEIDPQDPGKVFARRVITGFEQRFPGAPRNGTERAVVTESIHRGEDVP